VESVIKPEIGGPPGVPYYLRDDFSGAIGSLYKEPVTHQQLAPEVGNSG